MKTWINKGKEAACQQPLILVGIGIDQMRDFIHLGGTVRGAIAILPHGGPPFTPDEPFPVLVLEGQTRHVLDLVVYDFGLTCERRTTEIGAFLDHIDPKEAGKLGKPARPQAREQLYRHHLNGHKFALFSHTA